MPAALRQRWCRAGARKRELGLATWPTRGGWPCRFVATSLFDPGSCGTVLGEAATLPLGRNDRRDGERAEGMPSPGQLSPDGVSGLEHCAAVRKDAGAELGGDVLGAIAGA